MFAAMGRGPVAGPLAALVVGFMRDEASQIGVMGMSYDGGDPWGGSHQGTGNPSAIAGYNAYGIAVNSQGQPVYGWNTSAQAYVDRQYKSFSAWWNSKKDVTDKELHSKEVMEAAKYGIAEDYITGKRIGKGEEDPYSEGDWDISDTLTVSTQEEATSASQDDKGGTVAPDPSEKPMAPETPETPMDRGDDSGGGPGDDSAGPGGDESTGPGSGFGY